MVIKTIIVGLTNDRALNSVYVALDVAKLFDAHIVGFVGRYIPPILAPDPTGALAQAIQDADAQVLEAAEKAFVATVPAERRAGWRAVVNLPDRGLAIEGRAADLIVVGGSDETRAYYDLGSLIVNAGRPVLVTADHLPTIAAKRIVVGWKDTREARRAVADSLAFLTQASEVVLALIDEGDGVDRHGGAEVQRYLARHGISSRIEAASAFGDKNAAGKLRDIARHIGADMIVAGAYGHSRFREMIFGGVTKSLLQDRTMHHLMSS
ncbi:MAG: universal stress protein UspA [Bauldia sp.]